MAAVCRFEMEKKHDEESEKRLESRLNRFETVENIEKVVGTLKKL
jgi:hypothetical protein